MRQNYLRALGGAAVIAAMAVSAAGCQKSGTATGTAASCGGKLAIFGAFTGGDSGLVLPSRDASRLAVEKFNQENPDCKVELVEFDTQGDPANATGPANQIAADQKYLGVIGGHFSGESRATIPTYKAAGLAMVAPSATAVDLTATETTVFHRVVGNDGVQGPAAGRYVKDTVKGQKVFVVDDGSTYGAGLAEQVIKTLGSAVAGTDKVQKGQTNFSVPVGKVKAAGADVVFYGGYTTEAAPFLKQLRDGGVTAKFVGGDGIAEPNFPKGAGSAAEGAMVTCPCIPGEQTAGSFRDSWKAKFKTEPGVYAAEGWDATTIFLDAFKAGKNTRKDVLDYVHAYDKDAVTKHIKFDKNGDIEESKVRIWAYVVKDGQIVADQEIPRS